jgi:hypothetical protein
MLNAFLIFSDIAFNLEIVWHLSVYNVLFYQSEYLHKHHYIPER